VRAWGSGASSLLYIPILLLPFAILAHIYILGRPLYLQWTSAPPGAADLMLSVADGAAVGVYVFAMISAVILLIVDLVSRLYRRAFGFIGFLFSASGFAYAIFVIGAVLWAPGEFQTAAAYSNEYLGLAAVVVQVLTTLFSGVVSGELALYFAWLTVAPHRDYLAVRGWRPPFWHVFANVRRSWGLPAFLSVLKKRRLRLTALHYLVAFVNSPFFLAIFVPMIVLEAVAVPAEFRLMLLIAGAPIIAAIGVPVLLWLTGVGRGAATLARRTATDVYQGVREWDKRNPIIFLRSFKSDAATLRLRTANPVLTWPGGLSGRRSLDELLLEHGSLYGPVIAIGGPQQPLPPLGAARVFVKDESWQSVVQSLTSASQSVVICPNRTPGVAWEIALVASPEHLAKAIFLRDPALPLDDQASLLDFLPDGAVAKSNLKLPRGEVGVALYYDVQRGWTLLSCRNPTCHAYEIALKTALFGKTGVLHVPLPAA